MVKNDPYDVQQTVQLSVLNNAFVLVFLAQFQLIYHSHILFSECSKDICPCVGLTLVQILRIYIHKVV